MTGTGSTRRCPRTRSPRRRSPSTSTRRRTPSPVGRSSTAAGPTATPIRPEEFVNVFRQDYRAARRRRLHGHRRRRRAARGHEIAGAERYRLLRIGLQTRADDPSVRRRTRRSPSSWTCPARWPSPAGSTWCSDALHTLVDQLRAERPRRDRRLRRRGAGAARDDPGPQRPGPARARSTTSSRAAHQPGGRPGPGYRVARDGFVGGASNRVILLSDGLANVGNTDAEPILEQIREEAGEGDLAARRRRRPRVRRRAHGAPGRPGRRLRHLRLRARAGPASSSWTGCRRRSLVRALRRQGAGDVRSRPQWPATASSGTRTGLIADEDFRDDRVDGGEVGPGHSVTALYLVRLRGEARRPCRRGPGAVARSGRPGGERERGERRRSPTSTASSLATRRPGCGSPTPPRTSLRCCAAARTRDEVRLGGLAELADGASRQTDDGDVAELADLIRRTDERPAR